jgi:hypothetical protein
MNHRSHRKERRRAPMPATLEYRFMDSTLPLEREKSNAVETGHEMC